MNCSDAQSQTAYSDVQGQTSLTNVLSHNYIPKTTAGTAPQAEPYAAAGSALQPMGPYATAGGTQPTAAYPAAGQFYPITPTTQPPAMTLDSLQYLNAALRTQIGSKVTVSFLIGTNTFQDRTGILLAVGANYIIINEVETDDILFCDFYTIKFVKVYR
jgi:hypothetical protein